MSRETYTISRKEGQRALCVFCGAQNTIPKVHLDAGAEFGRMMAEENIRLVYGGGDCGVMGAIANGVMEHGGQVTGVFPRELKNIEREHLGISEIIHVGSMHERKLTMFQMSDAFIMFPGGFGTLDETFEIITWKQLLVHDKPVIVFNHDDYWDHWIKLTDHIIDQGFARPSTRALYSITDDINRILPMIYGD